MTTATATESRGLVTKAPGGGTINGLPMIVGALIPWNDALAGTVSMYVVKVELSPDEVDLLQPCPHHAGLEFRNAERLAEHVADDEERIAALRDAIPTLRKQAKASREDAESLPPRAYTPPHAQEKDRARLRSSADRYERDADAMEQELAALTGETVADQEGDETT